MNRAAFAPPCSASRRNTCAGRWKTWWKRTWSTASMCRMRSSTGRAWPWTGCWRYADPFPRWAGFSFRRRSDKTLAPIARTSITRSLVARTSDTRTMAQPKTFTLEEAQRLLPVLQALLKRSMDGKLLIEQMEKEMQDLKHRILLSGGLMVDIPAVARRRAEHDKSLQEIKDALAEIDAIGVQVKDLDMGLLDFPCQVGDDIILLCWKYGE